MMSNKTSGFNSFDSRIKKIQDMPLFYISSHLSCHTCVSSKTPHVFSNPTHLLFLFCPPPPSPSFSLATLSPTPPYSYLLPSLQARKKTVVDFYIFFLFLSLSLSLSHMCIKVYKEKISYDPFKEIHKAYI